MKPSEFKKIIKEAVKEAIQEELKDILLEAVKTPKTVVRESYSPTTQPNQPTQLIINTNTSNIVATKEDSKQRDLLPLVGESLRILEPITEKTPARWNVPFTTHLQSTDSLSDFQWIGVSPDSPRLKAPGKRVVIDLTQPNCAGQYSDRLLSVRHLAEMAIADIARTNAPASEQDRRSRARANGCSADTARRRSYW